MNVMDLLIIKRWFYKQKKKKIVNIKDFKEIIKQLQEQYFNVKRRFKNEFYKSDIIYFIIMT